MPSVPHDDASIWGAMARELANNPDSPASLRIRSAVNSALRPVNDCVEQLRVAIKSLLVEPSDRARIAFDAAKAGWEAATQSKLTDDIVEGLRAECAQELERGRRGPPPIESIVEGVQDRSDVGYREGLHLHGLRGSWHRLWALVALGVALGEDEEHGQAVAAMRDQFESVLGRALSATEWSALEARAREAGALQRKRLDAEG